MNPQTQPDDFEVMVRIAQDLRRTGSSRTLAGWMREAERAGGRDYVAAMQAAAKVAQRLSQNKLGNIAR